MRCGDAVVNASFLMSDGDFWTSSPVDCLTLLNVESAFRLSCDELIAGFDVGWWCSLPLMWALELRLHLTLKARLHWCFAFLRGLPQPSARYQPGNVPLN